MPKQKKIPIMMVLGVLFTLIALIALIAILRLKSLADTVVSPTQTAYVDQAGPTVDAIVPSMTENGSDISLPDPGFVVQEDTTKTLFVRGTVSDLNGCLNLMSVKISAYRSSVQGGVDCMLDKNECYSTTVPAESLLNCSGGGDTSADFAVQIPISYFADPTDVGSPYDADTWQVTAVATDNTEIPSDPLTGSFEVQSLAAFGLSDAVLNYGSVSLGATSDELELVFHNSGNRLVDSFLSSDGNLTRLDLGGFSPIASAQVKYSLDESFDWASSTQATSIGIGEQNKTDIPLNLAQQTNDTKAVIKSTFFQLKMPTSGVSGSYSNILTFTAHAL